MSKPADLLRHKPLFDDFVARSPRPLSVYHFSSIFLWQDFFDFTFEVIDGYLCVWARYELGVFLYLPPLGRPLDAPIIETCFARLRRLNTRTGVGRIENIGEDDLPLFSPPFKTAKKSDEYCYVREDIAALKGNAYKSKRSDYNHFVRHHDHQLIRFDRRLREDCFNLYEAWARNRAARFHDDIFKAMLEDNRRVHQLIFEYSDDLGLEGRVVMTDQKPQAYSFGYSLNSDTFCVLVETSNLEIKGLSAYIFSRFCADEALKNFRLINAMDDFAMENVTAAKRSYRPCQLRPSYVVTENL